MNLTIRSKPFLGAFLKASLLDGKFKNKSDPLAYVLLEYHGTTARLRSTNGKARLSIPVDGLVEGNHDSCSVLLSREKAGKILATARSGLTTLSTLTGGKPSTGWSADHLQIHTPDGKFLLPWADPLLFPIQDAEPSFPDDKTIVAAADLRRVLDQTMFATDVESTRYALGCLLVETDRGFLRFVATDGRRLVRSSALCDSEGKGGLPVEDAAAKALMPVGMARLLRKLLDLATEAEPVELAVKPVGLGNFTFTICCASFWLEFPGGEGRFPRYQDVFPAASGVTTRLAWNDAEPLLRACTLAKVCTSDESRSVNLLVEPGSLPKIYAAGPDLGEAEVIVEDAVVEANGPFELSFQPSYLTEFLKTIPVGHALTLELTDRKTAFTATSGNVEYVLMPMTDSPTSDERRASARSQPQVATAEVRA